MHNPLICLFGCIYIIQVNYTKDYMSHCHLPSDLKQQVCQYYDNKYYGKVFNEEAILKELSHPLREVRNCYESIVKSSNSVFISQIKFGFDFYNTHILLDALIILTGKVL